MAISNVNTGFAYSNYSNINRIRTIADNDVSQVSQVNQAPPIQTTVDTSPQQDFQQAPKKANLENFNFEFKKSNDYNLVGAQSKLEDLDVDKALSEMQKDSVLDQYKFFVKSSLITDEDGSVKQVLR